MDDVKNAEQGAEEFEVTKLNKLRRLPKRGVFDKDTVYKILDEAIWCYVGFNIDLQNMNADKSDKHNSNDEDETKQASQLQPCVIPTLFGRQDDTIYIHGSSISRMLRTLTFGKTVPLCLTVALFDAFVMAKAAFHHSANYRSVVIYGRGQLIQDKQQKLNALQIISDHILPDRWQHTRLPTDAELKQTSVLRIQMECVSAKQRAGPPGDDKQDLNLPIWSGLLPIEQSLGIAQPDQYTQQMKLDVPDHIVEWENKKWNKRLKRDPKTIAINTDIIFMVCAWLVLFVAIWKAPVQWVPPMKFASF